MNIKDRKIPSTFGSELMVARFKAKIAVNRETGCHEWQGCLQSRGYGMIRIQGVVDYVHRIAWRLSKGEIPDGLLVLHKCDNPKCVNVDHHFLGTQKDNIADMHAKGRHPHPKRLTEEQRREAKRKANRRWRMRNRAHIAAYNREYQRKVRKNV